MNAATKRSIIAAVFNGAQSRPFEGLFIDTLVSEARLDQLLGVTRDDSQTAILADVLTNPGRQFPLAPT
jgi:hypothetical protein